MMNSFRAKTADIWPFCRVLLLWLLAVAFAPQQAHAVTTVSASSYGLSTGNGGSTNATDLQNALNSGNQVVTIPTGAFNIGPAMVTVPAGVALVGTSGTQLNPVSGTQGVLDMLSNSSAENITFNCGNATPTATNGVSQDAYEGIINVGVIQTTSNVGGVNIYNCTVNNSTLDAVYLTNTIAVAEPTTASTPTAVEGCSFNNDHEGVEADWFYNLKVYYNNVTNMGSHGMQFWGLNASTSMNCREAGNIDVESNYVNNVGTVSRAAGIWCSACQNITFKNNQVSNCTDGCLDMEWSSQGRMCNNTLSGAGYGEIADYFSSEDIVIADNQITNNDGAGNNTGIYFANENTNPSSGGYTNDLGYRNVLIYGITITDLADGASPQYPIWIASQTSANISFYNNTIHGGGNICVFPSAFPVTGTNNFTMNNTTLTGLSNPPNALTGDFSFEQPIVGANNYTLNPSDLLEQYHTFSWWSQAAAGIAANGSSLSNPNAPLGSQAGYVQQLGGISDSIWTTGGTYNVSFYAAQQNAANSEPVRVLIDGNWIGDFTPGTSYAQYSTSSIPLSEGNHVLTFEGLNSASNSNYAFIDSYSVNYISSTLPNAVQNGGFENTTNPLTNWTWGDTSGWPATEQADTSGSNSHSGTNSVEFTCSTESYTPGHYGVLSQNITGLTVGQTYYLSYWCKGSNIGFYEGIEIGAREEYWAPAPSGSYSGWQCVSTAFTADASSMQLGILVQDSPGAMTWYVDDISVAQQPTNLVQNGGFEISQAIFGNGSVSDWGYNGAYEPPTALDSTVAHSGGSSVSMTWSSPLTGGYFSYLTQTVSSLTPSNTYYLSAWVKGSSVGTNEEMEVGSGTPYAYLPSGTFGWQPVTLSFTPTSSTEPIEFVVQDPTDDLWIDDVTVPVQQPTFALNGSFENGQSPWSWATGGTITATQSIDTSGSNSHSGTYSAALTCSSLTSGSWGRLSEYAGGLTIGQTYYLEAWVKGTTVAAGSQLASGSSSQFRRSLPSGNFGWTKVTLAFVADATSEPIMVLVNNTATSLYVDDVTLSSEPI